MLLGLLWRNHFWSQTANIVCNERCVLCVQPEEEISWHLCSGSQRAIKFQVGCQVNALTPFSLVESSGSQLLSVESLVFFRNFQFYRDRIHQRYCMVVISAIECDLLMLLVLWLFRDGSYLSGLRSGIWCLSSKYRNIFSLVASTNCKQLFSSPGFALIAIVSWFPPEGECGIDSPRERFLNEFGFNEWLVAPFFMKYWQTNNLCAWN